MFWVVLDSLTLYLSLAAVITDGNLQHSYHFLTVNSDDYMLAVPTTSYRFKEAHVKLTILESQVKVY